MRWFDLYMGLMATTMGLGAAVGWRAGMPAEAVGGFLAIGFGFLVLMMWGAAHADRVILVGGPSKDPSFDMRASLIDEGFAVRTCVGPAERPCPVLDGHACPIGGHPVAAVVQIPVGYGGRAAPCGSAYGVPMLEIREVTGAPFAAEISDDRAAIRAPDDVIAAMDRALSVSG